MSTTIQTTINNTDKEPSINDMKTNAKDKLKNLALNSLYNFIITNISLWGTILVALYIYGEPFYSAVENIFNALFNKYTVTFLSLSFFVLLIIWFFMSLRNNEDTNKKLKKLLFLIIVNLECIFFLFFIGVCFHIFNMPIPIEMNDMSSMLIALATVFIAILAKVLFTTKLSTINEYDEEMISVIIVSTLIICTIVAIYFL